MIQTASNNIPISTRPRWFKDYADLSTFIDPLFDGANIHPTGNRNYALVGLTTSQAEQLGVKGTTTTSSEHRQGCQQRALRKSATHASPATRRRPRADGADRAVDPVHVGEQVNIIGLEGRKLDLRPVVGLCRTRARRR